jgi:hypothetical protein
MCLVQHTLSVAAINFQIFRQSTKLPDFLRRRDDSVPNVPTLSVADDVESLRHATDTRLSSVADSPPPAYFLQPPPLAYDGGRGADSLPPVSLALLDNSLYVSPFAYTDIADQPNSYGQGKYRSVLEQAPVFSSSLRCSDWLFSRRFWKLLPTMGI